MPKYLINASYTAEGLRGLQKDKASGRQQAVKKAVRALGGRLEAIYYCFGGDDVILIADLPDNTSAAAVSLAAGSTGLVTIRTTPLLTVEEVDEALDKTVPYRPPGG
jgi:uncharacterized protein with GYD domain